MYGFLIWNLFLAGIPFLLSLIIFYFYRSHPKKVGFFILAFLWLLFFPNSLYIITDFIHLRPRNGVPLWFDLVLILSFAWDGLFLGFISLQIIHEIIAKAWNKVVGWVTALSVLFLSSFGIYLGRFLRWNSWDVLSDPNELLYDIVDRIVNPWIHPRTYGVTIMLFLFFSTSYVLLVQLGKQKNRL